MAVKHTWIVLALALAGQRATAGPSAADSFDTLKTLAGQWQAQLPGFGTIDNTLRVVSNGRAIEETIGTAADNEVSLYTVDGERLLLTHFCAMTADGHQVRLDAGRAPGLDAGLVFVFRDATNLHSLQAPHMRRVVLRVVDHDHFSETWTKTERGVDTVFELNFIRQPAP